ncbi:MAG: hypothetical protein JXR76_00135 [Deltaproteobacteria bacterium]|nr:hypothetical protein [Deltaproteobacteria bacterium]
MNKLKYVTMLLLLLMVCTAKVSAAESQREYEIRFQIMLQYAVDINEYVRRHLQDKNLCSYAEEMTATNARLAEQMTPPEKFAEIHPHFLLVLENVERSFYYATQGRLTRYRHHQKIVNKELSILEALADRVGMKPYYEKY